MNNIIMNPEIGWFAPLLKKVKCSRKGNLRLLKWIDKSNGNLVWCEKCGCLGRVNGDNTKLLRVYEYEYSIIVNETIKEEEEVICN